MSNRIGSELVVRHGLAAALAGGLLAACTVIPPAIRDLPELPVEYAKDLAVAKAAPVLMTRPATPAARPAARPASPPPLLAPPRACTSTWDGYVTYPITVCHPPNELYEVLDLSGAEIEIAPPAGRIGVIPVRRFKLTSHPQVRLGPWFCTVRGGPWYAHVEGAQICNTDPSVRHFTAQLLGAPEPVVVIWSGALTDVPPPLNLFGITPSGEFCTCCSGVMCPDGSCVPDFRQCDVRPPASK